jgi:MerR family transcriptional regulator, aldehyde-responsive regulator
VARRTGLAESALRREIARLQLRQRYASAKADLWAARVSGDLAAEERITPTAIALGAELLKEEVELHDD